MFGEATTSRFWSRVEKKEDHECWPWLGGKNSAGYGVFYVSPKVPVLATRYACSVPRRMLPDRSVYCLHSCDNPSCCNPRHLRWGTARDNVRDAIIRKRHVNPPPSKGNPNPPRGEAHANASVNEDTVREIWRLHLLNHSAAEIARTLNIPHCIAFQVSRGKTWRHLPDAPPIDILKTGGVRPGRYKRAT